MARLDKRTSAFKACRGPYPWWEFEKMLFGLGFEELKAGKTGGSIRKYRHSKTGQIIRLHEPHDGEMGPDMVRRLQSDLSNGGWI